MSGIVSSGLFSCNLNVLTPPLLPVEPAMGIEVICYGVEDMTEDEALLQGLPDPPRATTDQNGMFVILDISVGKYMLCSRVIGTPFSDEKGKAIIVEIAAGQIVRVEGFVPTYVPE